jgi:hypothetical protein
MLLKIEASAQRPAARPREATLVTEDRSGLGRGKIAGKLAASENDTLPDVLPREGRKGLREAQRLLSCPRADDLQPPPHSLSAWQTPVVSNFPRVYYAKGLV